MSCTLHNESIQSKRNWQNVLCHPDFPLVCVNRKFTSIPNDIEEGPRDGLNGPDVLSPEIISLRCIAVNSCASNESAARATNELES